MALSHWRLGNIDTLYFSVRKWSKNSSKNLRVFIVTPLLVIFNFPKFQTITMKTLSPTRFQSGELAKRVLCKYKNVLHKDFKMSWLHFKVEGCAHAKFKIYIKKYGESENVSFKNPPRRLLVIVMPRKWVKCFGSKEIEFRSNQILFLKKLN